MNQIAKCQCGMLQAKVTGEPVSVNVCHCMSCRRRTGAAVSYNIYFQQSDVELSGPSQTYVRDAQEERKLNNHFCPSCGTTVCWTLDFRPDLYGIGGGLFDGTALPPPQRSFYERTKCE